MRELQRCAEAGNVPQNEAFERTRNENLYLRKQLVEVQSKLTRLTETLQALTGSVSNALHECPTAEPKEYVDIDSLEEFSGSLSQDVIAEPQILGSAVCSSSGGHDQLPSLEPLTVTGPTSNFSQLSPGFGASCEAFDWQSLPNDINCLFPQIPNIWSHEYQMGLQPYTKALSESVSSSLIRGKPWVETNSPFSDHISTLRDLMKTSIGQIGGKSQQQERYHHLRVVSLYCANDYVAVFTAKSWLYSRFSTVSHDQQPWHGMQKQDSTISLT